MPSRWPFYPTYWAADTFDLKRSGWVGDTTVLWSRRVAAVVNIFFLCSSAILLAVISSAAVKQLGWLDETVQISGMAAVAMENETVGGGTSTWAMLIQFWALLHNDGRWGKVVTAGWCSAGSGAIIVVAHLLMRPLRNPEPLFSLAIAALSNALVLGVIRFRWGGIGEEGSVAILTANFICLVLRAAAVRHSRQARTRSADAGGWTLLYSLEDVMRFVPAEIQSLVGDSSS